MRYELTEHNEAINYLSKTGTKAALQTQCDGPYIFAVKSDLIQILKARQDDKFCDYNGDIYPVSVINNVLHIPYGII
jgi:hypothetical protein